MNLNEIQNILKDQLKCSENKIKAITNILRVVRANESRAKSELIEIIERESKNEITLN